MSKIRILPDILSNKIAAGEVVERPGSVVKELLENSIDAGSERVMVEVENGGKSSIRVSDDGCGMSHDDALLAIERFATSKIRSDQDLFNIGTLGFRGEAIPSIASVSRFTLVTREQDSDTGFSVRIDGGKLVKASETGAPKGTMIIVGQLFYNTPARRKFLKSVNTETGHVADVVSNMAMAYPRVHFRLDHNGRTVKNLTACSDPMERIAEVVGQTLKKDLYPINYAEDSVAVTGAVAAPRINRTTSRSIYVYVNGRFVRDRAVQHAIFAGYGQRLMKGQFPAAAIFLKIPPGNVDVNVHPTKHEVRFADHRAVHDAVARAVEETLKRWENPVKWSGEERFGEIPANVSESADSFVRPEKEEAPSPIQGKSPAPATPRPAFEPKENEAHSHAEPPGREEFVRQEEKPVPKESADDRERPNERPSMWKERRFSDLKFVGQVHNLYIVLETPTEIVLIDQHAAHERVLYESLKRKSEGRNPESQKLLIPETFDTTFSEADLLLKLIPAFEEIGLYMEPFGGNTFVVKAVPSFLEGREIQPVIREIVEKALEIGVNPDLGKAMDESLKLMACHGAIRASQKLSDLQIKGLLRQLDGCETPSNCPHGRPTWIKWDLKSLEKAFLRMA